MKSSFIRTKEIPIRLQMHMRINNSNDQYQTQSLRRKRLVPSELVFVPVTTLLYDRLYFISVKHGWLISVSPFIRTKEIPIRLQMHMRINNSNDQYQTQSLRRKRLVPSELVFVPVTTLLYDRLYFISVKHGWLISVSPLGTTVVNDLSLLIWLNWWRSVSIINKVWKTNSLYNDYLHSLTPQLEAGHQLESGHRSLEVVHRSVNILKLRSEVKSAPWPRVTLPVTSLSRTCKYD